ncbi:MAG TPA: hypothetical protein VLG38_07285 [Gammaproteobacteria bacterium]|nr:hypothetical protein [Gammaproteobacteria bacterium]
MELATIKITNLKKQLLISALCVFGSTCVYAASDEWHFNIIPYFWAVNVEGDIEVGVPAEGISNQLLHISEDYKSIMKHVHSGGILDVNVSKGRFGIFLNAMYVDLRNLEITTSDGFEVQENTKYEIYGAGAFYKIIDYKLGPFSNFAWGPYAGARYTNNLSSATLIEAPEYGSSYNAHWTEPFVGTTLTFDITKHWTINVAADVGIIAKQQDSYNLIGMIGFKPLDYLTIYAGYRQFYQSFIKGSGASFFEWKMHMRGPIVGFAFGV